MTEARKKPVALLIEDEAGYQHALRQQLKAQGFSVVTVNNVADAANALGLRYEYFPDKQDLRLLPVNSADQQQIISVIISDHDLVWEGLDFAALKGRIPALTELKTPQSMLSFTTGGAFIDRLQSSILEGHIAPSYIPPVIAHCGNPDDMMANGELDIVKAIFCKGDFDEEKIDARAAEIAKAAADLLVGKAVSKPDLQGWISSDQPTGRPKR